ncbi:MAG: hypothetical protein Q4C87_01080 [Actinomycetaceae bacterium]|nr:hypothetical protein [Actinomycetaceae bacterium]
MNRFLMRLHDGPVPALVRAKIERYFASSWLKQTWISPRAVTRRSLVVRVFFSAMLVVAGVIGAQLFRAPLFPLTMRNVGAIAVISLLAIASATYEVWREKKNEQIERNRSRHIVKFNDELNGIIDALIKLARSERNEFAARQFIQTVLTAAVRLFPEDGLRICLYSLEVPLTDMESEDGQERESSFLPDGQENCFLHLVACGGRPDRPRSDFTQKTSWGRHAIEIARGHISRPFTDVPVVDGDGSEFQIDRRAGAVWKSYMQFPVVGQNQQCLGTLMIDSRDRIVWTIEHQAIGSTVARVLAQGLEDLSLGADDPIPESAHLKDSLAGLDANVGDAS